MCKSRASGGITSGKYGTPHSSRASQPLHGSVVGGLPGYKNVQSGGGDGGIFWSRMKSWGSGGASMGYSGFVSQLLSLGLNLGQNTGY